MTQLEEGKHNTSYISSMVMPSLRSETSESWAEFHRKFHSDDFHFSASNGKLLKMPSIRGMLSPGKDKQARALRRGSITFPGQNKNSFKWI
jgi:hypothetical protein